MTIPSRDQLLAKVKDLKREKLHVAEWDAEVFVRGMTAHERTTLRKKAADEDPHRVAWVVCRCVVDEKGQRILDDKDVKALTESSNAACEQILVVVQRLSDFDAEALERAVKNSDPTPSAG